MCSKRFSGENWFRAWPNATLCVWVSQSTKVVIVIAVGLLQLGCWLSLQLFVFAIPTVATAPAPATAIATTATTSNSESTRGRGGTQATTGETTGENYNVLGVSFAVSKAMKILYDGYNESVIKPGTISKNDELVQEEEVGLPLLHQTVLELAPELESQAGEQ
ncbi:hypothetical protein PWT90_02392 [Aphanocladium album]|nr:hypothetical protein PWT90_02392 [Aphanocladium album]